MIKIILYIILAVILLVVGVVAAVIFGILRSVRNVKKRFEESQYERREVDGQTIIDKRQDQERSSRQIIPDTEGEYVEYEDVE
ncbi:MAG: DUF4834 family protein [Prevotella sp.]|nr:DUF4834 family protein [Prevotella sp.]